ncbi:organic solute transporter Ostalpha-domain-containing protein, partial [Ochromonadaceae sp. CCMP2298]
MSFLTREGDPPAEGAYPTIELNQQAYGSFEADVDEEALEDFDLLPRRELPSRRERPSFSDGGLWGRFCPSFSSSALWNVLSLLNLALIIALAVLFSAHYKQNRQDMKVLTAELKHLKEASDTQYSSFYLELSKLRSAEDEYKSTTDNLFRQMGLNMSTVESTVHFHTKQLSRLLNGTSNAEVLEKLAQTETEVRHRLEEEHKDIQHDIEKSTRNVSERLAESSRALQETQRRVDDHLNASVTHMQSAVNTATSTLFQAQYNVTNKLDLMTNHVETIVAVLGQQVQEAQDTIEMEVSKVQNNIKQYVAVTNKQFAAENDFVRYQLAGTFTLLGCLISLWHITAHLRHYYKPDVQRRIMAVLWMVPIYSITSWLSLVLPRMEPFFGAIRDCFEAYVIYTFIALLIAVLEDGRGLAEMINKLAARRRATVLSKTRPVEHIRPPCPCCYRHHRPTSVAAAWLYQCQLMAAQFVLLKPLLTIIPLLLKATQVYNVDSVPMWINNGVNFKAPNLYIMFAQNLSVALAFYGLLCFYHGTEKDLEWCAPWPKFLCVKGVVFATFWQSAAIQLLSAMGRVDHRTASQIQNLLICIEMLIASLAHYYIFPHEEWEEGYK